MLCCYHYTVHWWFWCHSLLRLMSTLLSYLLLQNSVIFHFRYISWWIYVLMVRRYSRLVFHSHGLNAVESWIGRVRCVLRNVTLHVHLLLLLLRTWPVLNADGLLMLFGYTGMIWSLGDVNRSFISANWMIVVLTWGVGTCHKYWLWWGNGLYFTTTNLLAVVYHLFSWWLMSYQATSGSFTHLAELLSAHILLLIIKLVCHGKWHRFVLY